MVSTRSGRGGSGPWQAGARHPLPRFPGDQSGALRQLPSASDRPGDIVLSSNSPTAEPAGQNASDGGRDTDSASAVAGASDSTAGSALVVAAQSSTRTQDTHTKNQVPPLQPLAEGSASQRVEAEHDSTRSSDDDTVSEEYSGPLPIRSAACGPGGSRGPGLDTPTKDVTNVSRAL